MATILKIVLDWALAKARAFALGLYNIYMRHKTIDKESKESVKPGEKAKSEKEIDDSLRDSIGGGW